MHIVLYPFCRYSDNSTQYYFKYYLALKLCVCVCVCVYAWINTYVHISLGRRVQGAFNYWSPSYSALITVSRPPSTKTNFRDPCMLQPIVHSLDNTAFFMHSLGEWYKWTVSICTHIKGASYIGQCFGLKTTTHPWSYLDFQPSATLSIATLSIATLSARAHAHTHTHTHIYIYIYI